MFLPVFELNSERIPRNLLRGALILDPKALSLRPCEGINRQIKKWKLSLQVADLPKLVTGTSIQSEFYDI